MDRVQQEVYATNRRLGRLVEVQVQQNEKWKEVMRIGRLAAMATRLDDRTSYCADLLAELGLIHPTPDGKWDWMHRGEL